MSGLESLLELMNDDDNDISDISQKNEIKKGHVEEIYSSSDENDDLMESPKSMIKHKWEEDLIEKTLEKMNVMVDNWDMQKWKFFVKICNKKRDIINQNVDEFYKREKLYTERNHWIGDEKGASIKLSNLYTFIGVVSESR